MTSYLRVAACSQITVRIVGGSVQPTACDDDGPAIVIDGESMIRSTDDSGSPRSATMSWTIRFAGPTWSRHDARRRSECIAPKRRGAADTAPAALASLG
jgi:hypothetical protein